MNWYRSIRNELKVKEAGLFRDVAMMGLGALIPLAAFLGLTQQQLFRDVETKGVEQVKTTLIEEGKKKNAPIEIIEKAKSTTIPDKKLENKQLVPVQLPVQKDKSTTQPGEVPFPMEEFKQKLIGQEGYRDSVYSDTGRKGGKPTIGIGHLITKKSRELFEKLFGAAINFNNILKGKQKLTKEEIDILTNHDINEHIERAKKAIPKFSTYPGYVQIAILDSVYRGDMGPKTANLINNNKWADAAKEYVNRKDYANAIKNKMSGIRTRMDTNKSAFLQYAKELGQTTQIAKH